MPVTPGHLSLFDLVQCTKVQWLPGRPAVDWSPEGEIDAAGAEPGPS
jgi:hypothetical protein